jgi:CPA1 family monovalent cation:H+ antiporter
MLSPTDPVSVLGLFKELGVGEDLRTVVEGESLFNDGTGVVIFTILLDLATRGGDFRVPDAVVEFLRVSGGGLLMGAALGYLTYLFIRHMDDPMVETAACFCLAMGSFWLAEHVFHFSGVIATVVSGLFIGNYGRHLSMSREVTIAVENFFEVVDFLINSVIFILIGLEIRPVLAGGDWAEHLPLVGAAIAAFVVARAVTVYPVFHALNLVGRRRPRAWAHVLFWGGLRGSIPIALILGLDRDVPFYREFLVAGFAVVLFSLVVQGLTVGPLLRLLGLGGEPEGEPPPG